MRVLSDRVLDNLEVLRGTDTNKFYRKLLGICQCNV